jgi:hypothetical protein
VPSAPSFQLRSSPVFPSQNTISPLGMTTGPSGKPRSEASSVASTANILSTGETGMIAYQA